MQKKKGNGEITETIAERAERCLAKYAQGLSLNEIRKSENISRTTLNNIFYRSGITKRTIFKQRGENEFKDALHKALLKAVELNRIPITAELRDLNISYSLMKEIRDELKKGGFEKKHPNPIDKITNNELLNDMKRIAVRLNKTPNTHDIERHSKYSVGTFSDHFGSLVKAQELAGLKPNKRGAPVGNLNWVRSIKTK